MIDSILDHPAIPAGSVAVKSHSKFGSQVGYAHLLNAASEAEGIYYVGMLLEERHGGAPGRGHGGVTMAVLDEAMGRAASSALGKICFTASMTTNFCAGSKVGDYILATAKISRKGKKIVFVTAELHAGGTLIATATGTWVNSGMPIPSMVLDKD